VKKCFNSKVPEQAEEFVENEGFEEGKLTCFEGES